MRQFPTPFRISGWLAVLALSAAPSLHADDALALTYFRQGEFYFKKERYDEALIWYRKALEQRDDDGPVAVEERTVVRTLPHGRRARKLVYDDVLFEDYVPHQRVREAAEQLERVARLKHPPVIELSWVTLRDPTRDNVLDGGETATLVVNLRNTGGSSAREVRLVTTTDDMHGLVFTGKNTLLGNLEPGGQMLGEIEVHAQKNVAERSRRLAISVAEKDGFGSLPLEVVLQTRPHRPARMQIVDVDVQDLDNNDLIEPLEVVHVTARVQNTGDGVAENVEVEALLGDNVFLGPGSEKVFPLGDLYPGDVRDVRLAVLTNTQFQDGQRIPVALGIEGGDGYDGVRRDVELTIHVPRNSVIALGATGRPAVVPAARVSIDVDAEVPQGLHKRPNAIGVVIGNKDYGRAELPGVEYAVHDAKVMKDYLVNALGFSPDNVIYVENATTARFNEIFGNAENFAGRLFNYVTPNVSEVFIYYSGHGAPDALGQGAYFVPVDVNPSMLALSGYSLATFYANLARLPAREITVVLDTCFSGNSAGGALVNNASAPASRTPGPAPLPPRTALFASASEGQVSAWWPEKRHGLFTYWFLKGLSGTADGNGDGAVTTSEMHEYVAAAVPPQARKLTGQSQMPRLEQAADLTLIRYRAEAPVATR